MSVTIETEPEFWTPSGNPVVYTFSSDQTAQANFSYLVEVYINGTLEAREKRFPESGIYGRIDITAYAERATSAPNITNVFESSAGNDATILIKVIERFGDPVADGANASSGSSKVFKAKLGYSDFVNWQSSDYSFDTGSTTNNILTTFPSTEDFDIRLNQQKRVMCINNGNAMNLFVELFDSSGVSVASDTIPLTLVNVSIVNVGITDIVAASSITLLNFTNSEYYTFSFVGGVSGSTKTYRINIKRDCITTSAKRIHFISRLGSIESFTYKLYSNESGSVSSRGYAKERGSWNGNAYGFNLSDGINIDFQKVRQKNLLLRSDYMSEALQNWLENEMGVGALVYIEDDNDTSLGLRRVQTLKTAFKPKTTKQDVIFREDLLIKLEDFTSLSL